MNSKIPHEIMQRFPVAKYLSKQKTSIVFGFSIVLAFIHHVFSKHHSLKITSIINARQWKFLLTLPNKILNFKQPI